MLPHALLQLCGGVHAPIFLSVCLQNELTVRNRHMKTMCPLKKKISLLSPTVLSFLYLISGHVYSSSIICSTEPSVKSPPLPRSPTLTSIQTVLVAGRFDKYDFIRAQLKGQMKASLPDTCLSLCDWETLSCPGVKRKDQCGIHNMRPCSGAAARWLFHCRLFRI